LADKLFVLSHESTGRGWYAINGSSNQSNFGYEGLFKLLNLNPNAVMQAKFYEFKIPDKTSRLGLIVSNLFSSQTSEKPDISRYINC
jgi:hypothetical protein